MEAAKPNSWAEAGRIARERDMARGMHPSQRENRAVKRLEIRVTPLQLRTLQEAAKAKGLTLTEYVHGKLFD